MRGLELISIYKSFGELKVLQGISFQQSKGEILGLLGPSGSGKTTLLEIVAGLIEPDKGDCTWDGVSLLGIPPHQREFGLMFQEFALFPHKNVFKNVAFGLQMAGEDESDIRKRVKEVLKLVGLPGFGKREIATLSGGEQQRVALARAMAPEPRLVMLDEPLGSLDRTIRERLIEELREILKNASQTALYVTHDQEEAFRIADRVVIIGSGRTAQLGSPQDIYQHPNSPYVARFLGMENFLEGEAKPEGAGSILSTVIGAWYVKTAYNGKGQILLRPDRVIWGEVSETDYVNISGELLSKSFSGQTSQIQVLIKDFPLKFTLSNSDEDLAQPGDTIQLSFRADEALHFFPD